MSSIRELEQKGTPSLEAIITGAEMQLRPVLMATIGAALGLVPAALASGIGSEAQKPLARVVRGHVDGGVSDFIRGAHFLSSFDPSLIFQTTTRSGIRRRPSDRFRRTCPSE